MKKYSSRFVADYKAAQVLHKQGAVQAAERAYQQLLANSPHVEEVLGSLAQLYLQANRQRQAAETIEQLLSHLPDKIIYYEELVKLYDHLGEGEKAASCYRRLLARQPHLADTHYNLGYLLKRYRKYDEAISAYQDALNCHINGPEEVYLNMAVIYSDHLRREDLAKTALEKALKIKPDYIPAMFNLANIYEEAGDRGGAEALFEKVVIQDPSYYPALARLGDVRTFEDTADPLIQKMKVAVQKADVDISTRVDLYFTLGKAFNDCGAYDEAFAHYRKANAFNKQMGTGYDRVRQEEVTCNLMTTFSREWFANIAPISSASPIFICGMFRSGSTLTEQILASHPHVTAGGEVDFFVREIKNRFSSYPRSVPEGLGGQLEKLAKDYVVHLEKTFPGARHITDKRPDNFLHLGLLRSLFPNARIIHTSRNPLDNCLSVFFLRLGNAMNYATDLGDIAHYLLESKKLMAHWREMFGDNIFEVNYDKLVKEPRLVIERMLTFCGLDWSDSCLEFHRLDNIVKTASVWQVRQALYQKSSGRWRHYEEHLEDLRDMLSP